LSVDVDFRARRASCDCKPAAAVTRGRHAIHILIEGETTMRVMVIVKATADSETGALPDTELLTAMGRFNEELVKAGVMLAGEGLHPSSRGKRVRFAGEGRTVIDGPFAETKEQLLGFYVIEAKGLDDALEVARDLGRANPGGSYEIRPVGLFRPGSIAT